MLMQEAKKRGRQAAQLNGNNNNGASAQQQQPDWLAAVGFDEEYLAQERLLGLQKGHVPLGYTYDDGQCTTTSNTIYPFV